VSNAHFRTLFDVVLGAVTGDKFMIMNNTIMKPVAVIHLLPVLSSSITYLKRHALSRQQKIIKHTSLVNDSYCNNKIVKA